MHGWIASNPALALTRVRVKERPTGYFTQDEFKQICEAATTHYRRQDLPCAELNQRLLTFVLCLRWSGLRIGDAIQLERTRLDKNDRILLYMEKTGEPLGVVIPPKIAAAMRKLPGDKYFFWDGRANYKGVLRSWEYTLASLFKRAEIKKRAHPHMFRDTFAIELLLAGVPLDQVSKLLGHRSIKITERHYAPWVAARQKQLEESVRKAWA
jgi:integrase